MTTGASAVHGAFVQLPEGPFHYRYWSGTPTGRPPALLLHGGAASTEVWNRIAPALARTRPVYAMDLRGHGLSPKTPIGTYQLWRAADDVTEFITALSLQQPMIIGHSWGAAVALVQAAAAGTRHPAPGTSALVLAEPPPTFTTPQVIESAEAAAELAGRPLDELSALCSVFFPDRDGTDLRALCHGLHHTTPAVIRSYTTDAAEHADLIPLIANARPPLLLMRSDPKVRSVIDTASWDRIHEHLPATGTMLHIPGADHDIHRSRPDAFLTTIQAFAASTSSPSHSEGQPHKEGMNV
ncbi:alpha/beta fold hydrolase [Streptomyces sp. NPDC058989]|uniref:alpha/beta fold hydrolase n=1 Tax=Streptomyces sp. NPDC058989 TaxID=3346686 RepID=UPI0036CF537C